MKKRLITAALPYVNNVPHLGNLIQVLSADAFARFCRLRGYETCYVCGTDEYGTATETRAAEEGVSPRELCDRYWTVHDEIYRWFNIGFDKFGRTSTPIQTEIVQDVFKRLDANGFIGEKTVEQLYCPACRRFLADRYVRGTCPACGYDGARGDQCESCGKLLDPTDLKAPRCASCGAAPQLRSTRHLYIELPALKGALEAWLAATAEAGGWARNAVTMTQAWMRDGLRERAITRDLVWGIPVPKAGFENKVFYVWFDAPIGYVSITGNLAAERGLDWRGFVDSWWKNPAEVDLFQFIGKDNIPFHTVIFPSSQLGTGENWTMLHHMSSTEYLNYESGKFSKSKGVGVFGTDARETGIAADVWRFALLYNRPEKSDALFTWKEFGEKTNAELIGNLANLVNRTLSFVTRYYGGEIPAVSSSKEGGAPPCARTALRATPQAGGDPPATPPREQAPSQMEAMTETACGASFWQTVRDAEAKITGKLERAELRDAYHAIFELSSFANKTFQDGEPWKKRTVDPPAAAALIGNLCYLVRDLAIMMEPFTPQTAERVAGFFGKTFDKAVPGRLAWSDLGTASGLERVLNSEILFAKLEAKTMDALREKYAGTQGEKGRRDSGANLQPQCNGTVAEGFHGEGRYPCRAADRGNGEEGTSPSFALLDLRVAKIVKIEKHPKADKLYIETLEIDGEERIIVSGLAPFYKEEELLNKHIVVAYNLKEAKLRGVASKGMLLAASVKNADGGEAVEVLDAGDAPTGARVTLEGAGPSDAPAEIDIDTFFSVPIVVTDTVVNVEGAALTVHGAALKTARIANGSVG